MVYWPYQIRLFSVHAHDKVGEVPSSQACHRSNPLLLIFTFSTTQSLRQTMLLLLLRARQLLWRSWYVLRFHAQNTLLKSDLCAYVFVSMENHIKVIPPTNQTPVHFVEFKNTVGRNEGKYLRIVLIRLHSAFCSQC